MGGAVFEPGESCFNIIFMPSVSSVENYHVTWILASDWSSSVNIIFMPSVSSGFKTAEVFLKH